MVNPAGDLPFEQSGRLQHPQVFRNRRQRHCERRRQLAYGCFAERQPGQNGAACGIGEGREGGIELARNIVNHMV